MRRQVVKKKNTIEVTEEEAEEVSGYIDVTPEEAKELI